MLAGGVLPHADEFPELHARRGARGGGDAGGGGYARLPSTDHPADLDAIGSTHVFASWTRSRLLAVTFTNTAYVEEGLVTNLICSWRRLPWEAYVVVATDTGAADTLNALGPGYADHLHWAPAYWRGISPKKLRSTYRSTAEYVAFIHRRTMFVRVLAARLRGELDILVVTDGDTVWNHDPVGVVAAMVRVAREQATGGGTTPVHGADNAEAPSKTDRKLDAAVTPLADAAALLSEGRCDGYVVNDVHFEPGTPHRERVEPVGGFLIWRLNQRTDALFHLWTEVMRCLDSREQPALHAALSLTDGRTARPWDDVSRVPDSALVLCVLPEYHFPTSEFLTMRPNPGSRPVSLYMQRYGYSEPGDVARSVVVAHSNLKYKEDGNKVAWFMQFKLYFWSPARRACAAAAPRPALKTMALPSSSEPIAHVKHAVGWARVTSERAVDDGREGAWVHDMAEYLTYRHSPGERWAECRRDLLARSAA